MLAPAGTQSHEYVRARTVALVLWSATEPGCAAVAVALPGDARRTFDQPLAPVSRCRGALGACQVDHGQLGRPQQGADAGGKIALLDFDLQHRVRS